jgi:hypothetical protein
VTRVATDGRAVADVAAEIIKLRDLWPDLAHVPIGS